MNNKLENDVKMNNRYSLGCFILQQIATNCYDMVIADPPVPSAKKVAIRHKLNIKTT